MKTKKYDEVCECIGLLRTLRKDVSKVADVSVSYAWVLHALELTRDALAKGEVT